MWVWITKLYLPSSWLRDPKPSNDSIWLVCLVLSEHTSICLQPKDVRDCDTPNFQNSANALGAYSLAAAVVQSCEGWLSQSSSKEQTEVHSSWQAIRPASMRLQIRLNHPFFSMSSRRRAWHVHRWSCKARCCSIRKLRRSGSARKQSKFRCTACRLHP